MEIRNILPRLPSKIFAILMTLFVVLHLSAQEALFLQKIQWKSNANALEYKVEVQNVTTGRSENIKTDKTSTELSLAPGKYRYRVTAYDFLGKESSVSAWANFEVFKANTPKITSVDRNISTAEGESRVGINVNISDINASSKFELVSEDLEGSITPSERAKIGSTSSETGNITHLDFKNVPPGKWRLRVTNASGLSSVSELITVTGEKTYTEAEVAAIKAETEKAAKREFVENLDEYIRKAEEERIAREKAEAERIAREKAAEEERLRLEREEAERKRIAAEEKAKLEREEAERQRIAAEEKARLEREEAERQRVAREKAEAEEKARLEAERIAREKAEKAEAKRQAKLAKKNQPYEWKDISLVGGAGYTVSLYDSRIRDYYDNYMTPSLNVRAKFLPFKGRSNKFGFEIGYIGNRFESETEFYSAELISNIFDVKLLWQHKLVGNLFLTAKGGLGFDYIQKSIEYTSAQDSNKGLSSQVSYIYPVAAGGISLFYIPWKFIVLELGADFTHVLTSSASMGFVTPYAALGFRF